MRVFKLFKFFMSLGILITIVGYALRLNETGDFAGTIVMISGASLIVASLFLLISKWRDLDF